MRYIIATLVAFTVGVSALHAQQRDSVSLAYRFVPGQTIAFRVMSYDSIVVYDTVTRVLSRERAELVTYRCDSAVASGYAMTMVTTEYSATEWRDRGEPDTVKTHVWVGRSIPFLMAPSGRRLDLLAASSQPANAPGGPFAPMILPNFAAESGAVGDHGQFVNEQWLTDNVYPPLRWRGSGYRVIERRLDTLGERTVHVDLAEAGVMAYRQHEGRDPLSRARVNGAGRYYVVPRLGYPIAGSYEQINDFSLEFTGGRVVTGRHSSGMMFELVADSAHPDVGKAFKRPSARKRRHR